MSMTVELDWPANKGASGFQWSFPELPRVGDVIDDQHGHKSGRVKTVVWFLGERGVIHVRLVVSDD